MSPISEKREESMTSVVEGLREAFSQWRESIATPGLEFIYDTCSELILTSSSDVTVIAENPDVFLGYDQSLDPDTFSGVSQIQLSTVDAPIQTLAEMKGMQLRPPPKSLVKAEAQAVYNVTIALIVILGVIASYYLKLVRY